MQRQSFVRGLVVACTLILVGVAGAGCASDTTAVSAQGQATIVPTHTAAPRTPTATPKPAIVEDTALLGGAVYAFDKKFGSNNCCYRNGWDYQEPSGAIWTGVWYDGYTDGAIDEQSKDRVTTIANAGTDDTTANWTVSQADAICTPFLPPDAQFKGTTTLTDVAGGVSGSEKRYTSALLANTLPASDFTDVNGHAVAPGTFYMDFSAQYNGSPVMLVGSCVISTDEHTAQNL